MFRAAYATWVPGLPDKSLWKKVNMGFKLLPPILKRATGRPRTRRYKGVEEGGSTKRRARCKRCGGFGHLQKTCTEPVPDHHLLHHQSQSVQGRSQTRSMSL